MKRGKSGRGVQQGAMKEMRTGVGAAVAARPRGIGNLDNYSVQWSMETAGRDHELGGHDFKRIKVAGKLMFSVDDLQKEEAGSITATQYRMHYMGNNGVDKFEVFDTTQEGMEVYNAIVHSAEEDFDEEMQGDVLVVERMVVTPAHRGHRLGLFMIEAADTVINGHMSACIIKPYPLQFEGGESYGFPLSPELESMRFPLPPESESMQTYERAFEAARAQLITYYSRLGFHQHENTRYMIRWNGYNHPDLDRAMKGKSR